MRNRALLIIAVIALAYAAGGAKAQGASGQSKKRNKLNLDILSDDNPPASTRPPAPQAAPDIPPAGADGTRVVSIAGLPLTSVAISPDGSLVVAAVDNNLNDRNAAVYAWDLPSGKARWFHVLTGRITFMAFSPDGARIAVAVAGDGVEILSAKDGTPVKASGGEAEHYKLDPLIGLAFSPDGRLLVCAGPDHVYVYDTASGKPVWQSDNLNPDPNGHVAFQGLTCMALQPGPKPVIIAGKGPLVDGQVLAWDLNTGAPVAPPAALRQFCAEPLAAGRLPSTHELVLMLIRHDALDGVAFNSDGGRALAWGSLVEFNDNEDRMGGLLDLSSGAVRRMDGLNAPVALSPSGRLAASTSDDGKSAILWDCRTGKEITRLKGFTRSLLNLRLLQRDSGVIRAMAFAPDDRVLAAVDMEDVWGRLRLWDIGKYAPAASSGDVSWLFDPKWNATLQALLGPTVSSYREPDAGGKRFASDAARVDDAAVYARVQWSTPFAKESTFHIVWSGPDGKPILAYDKAVKAGATELWAGMTVKGTSAAKIGKYTAVITQDGKEVGRCSIDILTGSDDGGIGLSVGDKDGFVTVHGVVPGSPAERVGLKPGDRIVAVDGKPVTASSEAELRVRGTPGTPVRLTVKHAPDFKETSEMTLVRVLMPRVDDTKDK